MVYECEKCKAALPPSVTSCPKCGETFDDVVPSDAEAGPSGFGTTPSSNASPDSASASADSRRKAQLVNRSPAPAAGPPRAVVPTASAGPRLAGIYVLLLIIAGLLTALVLHLPAQGVVRPQWEYTLKDVPDADFTDQMNNMGKEGWDVVTARRASDGADTPTFSYEIVFKRAKQ